MTKEECQKKISEIKALMAQNPAESGGGENNSKENLQNMLEQYESAYADAPDTAEKTETEPLLSAVFYWYIQHLPF